MTQQTPYIGSKISLISKLDIRYEGILYTVDSKESTIALSKVRSFGTEDRNSAHVVPPQEDVYDYIIFKANDIKDLIVCETPKPPPVAPGLYKDPAILSVGPTPPAPPVVERSGSANSTPRNNTRSPTQPQQQTQQSWKNNDNKPNNSSYRQGGGYQNRNNQNRQHGYEGNNKQQQQPRNYDSQNRNGSNNYRQGNNQQQNRNYESQNRNNTYNNQSNRGGHRNSNQNRGNGGARPNGPRNRNNLKFENDYDFEKAYEQFKETLEAIVGDVQNVKLDDTHENDASSVKDGDAKSESFYDKNKSFFDSISCEALEKEDGVNTRPDWRKERLTNQETFGQQSVRSFGYRRGGYNNRGGGYNNRGGGYGNNSRQQGYDNNRQRGHDANRRGGYNNRGGSGYDNNRQQGGRDNNSRQQDESKRN